MKLFFLFNFFFFKFVSRFNPKGEFMYKNIFSRFSLFFSILLMLLAIASGNAWAQNNCGVSVDFSYVGKDTIQQQPLIERCIYRVNLVNTRNDVFEVRVKPQNTSTTSLSLINGSAAIVAGSAPPSYSWFYAGNVPFPTGNTYLGPLYVTGPAPQMIDVEFLNGNNAVICTAMLAGQCGSGGGVPSGNPCLVQNITVNTGYNPATGSVIPVTSNAFDPNWIVVSDPFPNTNEPRPASVITKFLSWANPLPGSQWIAVYNSPSNSTNGVYVFKRCFCIEKQTRAIVDLKVLADDIVDSILVCGMKLTNRTPNYTNNWFILPPREFRDTLNLPGVSCCIEVYVRNVSNVAFGLDIAGSIQQLPTLAPTLLADTCCKETKNWIIGQKFHDLNCNGKIDQGEPALQGWQINATSGANTYSATTGSDGWYAIQVPPGTYTINEVLQSGFQQSAGGPFIVTLSQGQVVQYDFLNCTAPPPCDTLGEIHLDSACCQFTIPIFLAQGIGGVSSVNWSLSGGTMESISPLMGCPFTLTPPNPYGTTSGTITFTPPCTVSPLNLGMEVTPTTATGEITLYLTINHGPNKVCRDTIRLKCDRAPITKCDSLSVTPYIFQNLQQSWRTFKITNLKQPTSRIKEVKIALTPPPCSPTYVWNGGGLFVDGNPVSWGYTTSGTPPYSTISMRCQNSPPAPQGTAAMYTVQFNLGVDYTCNWTDTVTLTVIHCDGDTCILTYNNWCAKPPKQCVISNVGSGFNPISMTLKQIRAIEVAIDTNLVPGTQKLHACTASIVPTTSGWEVLGVSIEDELTKEERESVKYLPWEGEVKLTKADEVRTGLIELQACGGPTKPIKSPWLIRAFLGSREPMSDTPTVNITFYDANANPIAFGEAKASILVSSVPIGIISPNNNGDEIIGIVPNPATDQLQVDLLLGTDGPVTLEVCDFFGRCRALLDLGLQTAGIHTATLSIVDLPTGSYTLRLRTSSGVSTAPLRIVR
jgi:hypothetical protein